MLKYRAYAKVNLTLDILGRYDNGYHRLDMLMQSISLHDTLYFEEAETLALCVQGAPAPQGEENLVLRAARLLQEQTGCKRGAQIRLIKRIPMQAGLGGGSADAAAALVGLNRLWRLELPEETLVQIAARLGADVPFCLLGGTARATGTGTELVPVRHTLKLNFALYKPAEGLSTPQVYALFDEIGKPTQSTQAALCALQAADLERFAAALQNSMETPACVLLPAVEEALQNMQACFPLCARMSGSGSAVFGLFESEKAARRAAQTLRGRFGSGEYACAVPRGVELCGDSETK